VLFASQRESPLLFAVAAPQVGLAPSDATNSVRLKRVGGHRRLVGEFRLPAGSAPLAGFPRVRFSHDGVTFLRTLALVQDAAQLPDVVFPCDVLIDCPYVAVEWANSPVATTLDATIWALPE
jgi:hypothetical protein